MRNSVKYLVFAALVAAFVALGGLIVHDKLHPTIDKNNDGKPDEFFVYGLDGNLKSIEKDRNFDGRIDHIEKFTDGVIADLQVDMNGNGVFEIKTHYDGQGRMETLARDLDEDGKPDRIIHFNPETQSREWYEEDTDHDGIMDKKVDGRKKLDK